jgi:predicted signal transduction protein with EAL and GGDEF domain
MIEHLRTASVEKLGVQLKIGHAIFPSEAVTFEQLIANAEQRMLHPNGNEQDGERLAAETATLNT